MNRLFCFTIYISVAVSGLLPSFGHSQPAGFINAIPKIRFLKTLTSSESRWKRYILLYPHHVLSMKASMPLTAQLYKLRTTISKWTQRCLMPNEPNSSNETYTGVCGYLRADSKTGIGNYQLYIWTVLSHTGWNVTFHQFEIPTNQGK